MVLNIIEYRRREEHLAKSRLTPPFFIDRIEENTNLMTKKQFVSSKGETWEWEETPETEAALKALRETEKRNATERLHSDIRELELKAPDYGVGK